MTSERYSCPDRMPIIAEASDPGGWLMTSFSGNLNEKEENSILVNLLGMLVCT